jgi:glucose/arabinose dehydrogenase
MLKHLLSVLLLGLLALPAAAQEPVIQVETPPDLAQYRLEEVASGLSRPLYLTNAGDGSGRLFVLEQTGRVWLLRDGGNQPQLFMDMTPLVSQDVLTGFSERGLLGIAFHPDFADNRTFYVHYSNRNGDTRIARYLTQADNPDAAAMDSGEIIFEHGQPYRNHNGGQLEFGPDGYLYIGLGDGGSANDPQNNGQNPQVLLGTIMRLDVDSGTPYAIPASNPVNTQNAELAPEVWAWGLRNPWRFSFDRATGDLYIADVGQNQWEEINFQPADSAGGENYGWRILEGSHRFSGESDPGTTVLPIAEYDHSQGCSVTGGYVYRGEALPALQGVYIYGDWCSGNIWATYRDASGAWQTLEFLRRTGMSISSFGEDEAGELYVVDYSGRVLKFVAA